MHRDNVSWVLDNGLHCVNSTVIDPNYVPIGNKDLIDRRQGRVVQVSPGGGLGDYVPFYFTPFSPMMYNIYTGRGGVTCRTNEEIVILVSSIHKLIEIRRPFVYTDRHAYTSLAMFFNDLSNLDKIDWALLQDRNFQRNSDDPEQIERYQAEALVYQYLPIEGLLGIVCYTDELKLQLEQQTQQRNLNLAVHKMKGWYF